MDAHERPDRGLRARVRALFAGTALVTCLALAACGSSDDGGAGTASSGSGSGESIRVVQIPTSVSEFTVTIRGGAEAEAKKLGVDYQIQIPAKPDVASQTATMNAVIASRPDVILLEPIDGQGMIPPVTQAKAAGIKVITYDSNLRDESLPDAFLSTDYVEGGRSIARELLRLTGDRGTMLYLALFPGLTFTQNLLRGYEDVMDGSSDVTQLPVGYTEYESSRASSIVSGALSRTPDLAGAFIGTFAEQKGALAALRSAGAIGRVRTVAWDATPDTVDNLKAGNIDVIISVPAYDYGVRLIQLAQELTDGRDVPAVTSLGDCVITRENLDDADVRPCIYRPIS